jgi:hypothetical protein
MIYDGCFDPFLSLFSLSKHTNTEEVPRSKEKKMPVKNTTELDAALKEIKSLDGVTHYLIMDTNGTIFFSLTFGDNSKNRHIEQVFLSSGTDGVMITSVLFM